MCCIVLIYFNYFILFYFILFYYLDDWNVAKKFLVEIHGFGLKTDLEIKEITEIDEFSCVIKPCRGSASFGVSKAHSLQEAKIMFRNLLGK